MDYIVLDMEWNQPWPGSPSSKKVLPVDIRGEIIQIGAVRVSEEQFVQDEFQIMVKPKYYRHLNRRVSKLTGIKEARLRDEGVPFPEAIEKFREWCGDDVVFLTWGFDDIGILRENLRLFPIYFFTGGVVARNGIYSACFLRKRGAAGVPAPPWGSCRAATEGL